MMRFLALLLFSALLLPFSTQGMAQGNLDGVYDVQGVNPNGSTYSGEVTIQRQGSSYQFRWRIGSQSFQGSGALRGGSLTVNWGQRYPVIYVVGNDGVLRGTWDNGRARENLFPRNVSAPQPQGGSGDLDGVYDVRGTNPNGTTYSGEVSIQSQGSSYFFRWRIGSQTFQGSGAQRGDSLTIDWGQQHPVIYIVGNDGVLRGTWDNGKAREDLFPRTVRAPEGSSELDGTYDVRGTNPNGTKYKGEVSIQYEGRTYNFRWRIASGQGFEGKGTLRGDTLTVNWGQQYPVIYNVGKDGVLRGTWNNGQGTEELYPKVVSTERPARPGEGTTASAPSGGFDETRSGGQLGSPDEAVAATGKVWD